MTIDPKELVRRGYDAVSYAYRGDDLDKATERRYAGWLSRLDPILPLGGDVLDLGCGCGLPAARLLASRFKVTGVDISPVQIGRARMLVPEATFHCADLTAFPLRAESFDGIVSFYAIIHVPIPEQRALIRNIAAALRPGGALLVTVGHRAWTGTEGDWLGGAGATMYLSHEGEDVFRRWIEKDGLRSESCVFVPESVGAAPLMCATR